MLHRRSLRGNVDRNESQNAVLPLWNVVPYVGTWIEMCTVSTPSGETVVVPYVGTWIEIYVSQNYEKNFPRRSLRGNVDRNQNRVNMSSAGNRRRSLRGNVDRNDLMSDL